MTGYIAYMEMKTVKSANYHLRGVTHICNIYVYIYIIVPTVVQKLCTKS